MNLPDTFAKKNLVAPNTKRVILRQAVKDGKGGSGAKMKIKISGDPKKVINSLSTLVGKQQEII